MGVSALTYYYDIETMTEEDSVCYGKKYWYENPIIAIIAAHAIQVLAVSLVIFYFGKEEEDVKAEINQIVLLTEDKEVAVDISLRHIY